MAAQNMIAVTFLHPRDSTQFKAEIGPQTTGAKALEGLVKSEFIEAPGPQRAYALQSKAGKTLALSSPLVSAGVVADDVVSVLENSSGA